MAERLTELSADDQERVAAVLTRHGRYIEAVAAKFSPNHDLVPDVVQQVAMKLCQSLHTFRERSNIRTWLFAVTRNEAINVYRKERSLEHTRAHIGAHTVDDVVDLEEALIDADERDQRRRLFHVGLREALTPRQRQALRQIAAPSGVKVTSSDSSCAKRARQRLRVWIAQTNESSETD